MVHYSETEVKDILMQLRIRCADMVNDGSNNGKLLADIILTTPILPLPTKEVERINFGCNCTNISKKYCPNWNGVSNTCDNEK